MWSSGWREGGLASLRWPRNSLSGVKQSCEIQFGEEAMVLMQKKKGLADIIPIKF